MELDGRRSPCSKGAGGLAAGEPKCFRHGRGVEPEQAARGRGGAERTDDAGPCQPRLRNSG